MRVRCRSVLYRDARELGNLSVCVCSMLVAPNESCLMVMCMIDYSVSTSDELLVIGLTLDLQKVCVC